MPKKFPNQKLITIHKEKCSQTDYYVRSNRDASFRACRDFSGRFANAFILWYYLSSIKDGSEWALSPEAVEEAVGLKIDAYNTAVEKLIEKRYLVLKSGNTVYDFYEVPQEEQGKEG